jgi:hypothetical protein
MNLGRVNSFDARCVVQEDPGEIVRGARPLTDEDAARLREQMAEAAREGRPRLSGLDEGVRLAMKGWRPGRAHQAGGPGPQ